MSLPYYISNEVRDLFKGVDVVDEECIEKKMTDKRFIQIKDRKTGNIHLCGILFVNVENNEFPVLLIDGHVYDFIHRISNIEIDTYILFMNVKAINVSKSRYVLTDKMVKLFVKRGIKFLHDGETFADLSTRKLSSGQPPYTYEGYLM